MDTIAPHVDIKLQPVTNSLDLLRQGTWHMDGAQIYDGIMTLTPVDLRIRNKRRNNQYQPNPPVNLYGSRLHADGQFALDVTITIKRGAQASLQLYASSPPLRFDDFRFLPSPELEFLITDHTFTVTTRTGEALQPQQLLNIDSSTLTNQLQIQRTANGSVHITLNGALAGTMPTHLLTGSEIWLGLHVDGGLATITKLTAVPINNDTLHHINTNTLKVGQATPNGLQTLVNPNNLLIGTGASLGPIVADKRYAQLVLGSDFGIITPENGLKPQDVQPQEGIFTFAESDALIDLAQRHNIKVHGHTLMFDKAMPQWMHDLPHDTQADKQRLRDVLWTHVYTVANHFKGRVASWDVWNELVDGFNRDAELSANPFTLALGEEVLDIAFNAARQADPDAIFFINDYGLETNPKGRGRFMLDLIKRAKKRGVPIDGLGIQGHVYQLPRDYIQPRTLKSLIKDAAKLGLQVRITELDVTASQGGGAQAQQFAEVAAVCLNAPNCTGYSVWGPTDAYGSTVSVHNGQLITGDALLYDAEFKQKQAYVDVANELRKR